MKPWLPLACLAGLLFAASKESVAWPKNDSRPVGDTTLMVRFGNEPLQPLSPSLYTSPAGVHVRQYKVLLTRAQAGKVGLQLQTGSDDSIQVKIMSVVGMHSYGTALRRVAANTLLELGSLTMQDLDCGSSQPCKPTRIVVDMRLINAPQGHLWVCQLVLEEE